MRATLIYFSTFVLCMYLYHASTVNQFKNYVTTPLISRIFMTKTSYIKFSRNHVKSPSWMDQPVAKGAGPCLTTATWRCRKNFSQWECSFLWKLRCHWLEFLRQRQIAVVRQGPVLLFWVHHNILPRLDPTTKPWHSLLCNTSVIWRVSWQLKLKISKYDPYKFLKCLTIHPLNCLVTHNGFW